MSKNINWKKVDGLLPVIVQDEKTKQVLMLAYMNEEAFELSKKSGFAHYYSRTKKRIWKKGEQSGNTQKIKSIFLDCDQDALLIEIEQIGGVSCHTGAVSCFFTSLDKPTKFNPSINETVKMYGIVDTLYHTILEKKGDDPSISYVSKLINGEENTLLKKIAEEAGELILAIKDKDEKEIVYEAADLLFHSLVALGKSEIHPDLVKQELHRRLGVSGITEKSSRDDKP